MIRMVVFDMAGTTIDEDEVVYKTLREAINQEGFSLTLDQVLAEGAGKEKFQAIRDLLLSYGGNQDPELAKRIFVRFRQMLGSAYQSLHIRPLDGAEDLFRTLRTRKIFVILNTGYDRDTAFLLLGKLKWKEHDILDAVITASDVERSRPWPDMIQLAMHKFGIEDSAEVAKVGDSVIDIEEGKNAGCGLSIGVTTGAQSREQLQSANPDYIIDGLTELLAIIESTSVKNRF